MVTSYVLGPGFDLKTLRKDKTKRFFDMARAESPSSVAALEDNFQFVLQLSVTYAPDGLFPPHSVFKVHLACLPNIHSICVGTHTSFNTYIYIFRVLPNTCNSQKKGFPYRDHPKGAQSKVFFFGNWQSGT